LQKSRVIKKKEQKTQSYVKINKTKQLSTKKETTPETKTMAKKRIRKILVPLKDLEENSVLPYSIIDQKGRVLVKAGSRLTRSVLQSLYELDRSFVIAEVMEEESVVAKEDVPLQLKQETLEDLQSTLEDLAQGKTVSLDALEKDTKNLIQAVELNPGLVVPIIQLKKYDDFTFTHSLNVAVISLFIGKFLNLSRQELLILGLGALLHDLGKLKIPVEILHKPKKLDERELSVVKRHPIDAKKILEEQTRLNSNKSQLIALQHHEKIDGSGYPLGLGSKETDFLSQITTVADIYEALTSDRPYRKGLPIGEVVEYLMGNAGYKLNMEVVETFIRHISPYQVGDLVKLSDGREAIVSELNPVLPFRPKVRIKVENEQGKPQLAEEVDLARITTLTITEELLSKSKIRLKD